MPNQPPALHGTRSRTCLFRGLALAAGLLSACGLPGGYAAAGIVQTTRQNTTNRSGTDQSKTNSNVRINVSFEKVDAKQQVILRYGAVLLKTKLKGITLKPGAAGVLALLLPEGVRLQAEIVAKGDVQTVILTKQGVNINDQLLIQGVAEAVR